MFWLTEDAILKCAHGGVVKLHPIQHWVTIDKRAILVQGDPLHRSISTCPNATPVTPPCRRTVSVDQGASYSVLVRIGGLPICMDTAKGATDWSQLSTIPFTVSSPGQSLVTVGA
ncbi:hypothetical protein JQ582_33045 [Bradyrhizobium japonicum]|uniref:hypothetical protein n=1 Tax=Bradyrhizobium japonicum TaxID=375 RepID=UPI001BA4A7CE|nr:hypothetical protein [Bradyrhizobium japonicum]MBR0748769.1 hypothetical protein [Bradyrhizobium japonicum]